jgi:hypothetical protein
MSGRKCCIKGCESEETGEKCEGITFHRFPQTNADSLQKWIKGDYFVASFRDILIISSLFF